jgi:ribosomal-protein-alanine N-acetyltransferase
MKEEDIESVVEIERACFSIPWTKKAFTDEIKKNKFAIYVVACIEDKVIGYGGMWKIIDEGHITNIAVHPNFRGIKAGSAIVNTLIKIANQKNIKYMTLELRVSNKAAYELYKKFNFKPEGIRKGYYSDDNEDAVIMNNYNPKPKEIHGNGRASKNSPQNHGGGSST